MGATYPMAVRWLEGRTVRTVPSARWRSMPRVCTPSTSLGITRTTAVGVVLNTVAAGGALLVVKLRPLTKAFVLIPRGLMQLKAGAADLAYADLRDARGFPRPGFCRRRIPVRSMASPRHTIGREIVLAPPRFARARRHVKHEASGITNLRTYGLGNGRFPPSHSNSSIRKCVTP